MTHKEFASINPFYRIAVVSVLFVAFFVMSINVVRADAWDDGYQAFRQGDYQAAFRLWQPLAERGDELAQYNLGWMYENGKGVPQDHNKSINWYTKSAKQGDIDAQYKLASKYANGQDVVQDLIVSMRWLKKVVDQESLEKINIIQSDADEGNPFAQFVFGVVLEQGKGLSKDEVKAVNWYRLSSEQGFVLAQFNLGIAYRDGNGVAEDHETALQWFQRAESQHDMRSVLTIGELHHHGDDKVRDYAEAKKWYEKAASAGNIRAELNIGELHYFGQGVDRNSTEALKSIVKVAEGIDSELVNSIKYEANEGNVYKQVVLGYLYREGKGVEKDVKTSFDWILKAAEQEDMFAQRFVGKAYQIGDWVEKDIDEALKWYRKAAAQGDLDAEVLVQKLEDDLEGERIAEEERLERERVAKAEQEERERIAKAEQEERERIAKEAREERERIAKLKEQQQFCNDVAGAVAKLEPSSSGTAFVVNAEGEALTNYHVIEECRVSTTAFINPYPFSIDSHLRAKVIASDPSNDLAVIETCRTDLSEVAVFREGKPIRKAEEVLAIGFPYADELSSEAKITHGIITSVRGWGDISSVMQISAAVQPGNSGGPLLDRSGNVVGVIVARKTSEISEVHDEDDEVDIYVDVPQNVNFAIKSSTAMEFLDTNDVYYDTAPSVSDLHRADISDRGEAFTVLVVCWQ